MGWQYRKINLNELPRKTDEIDVLCDAGEQRWIVTILPEHIGVLETRDRSRGSASSARL